MEWRLTECWWRLSEGQIRLFWVHNLTMTKVQRHRVIAFSSFLAPGQLMSSWVCWKTYMTVIILNLKHDDKMLFLGGLVDERVCRIICIITLVAAWECFLWCMNQTGNFARPWLPIVGILDVSLNVEWKSFYSFKIFLRFRRLNARLFAQCLISSLF